MGQIVPLPQPEELSPHRDLIAREVLDHTDPGAKQRAMDLINSADRTMSDIIACWSDEDFIHIPGLVAELDQTLRDLGLVHAATIAQTVAVAAGQGDRAATAATLARLHRATLRSMQVMYD